MHYTAPSPPTDLRALLSTGGNAITVYWTPPSGGFPPTGYMINYYETTDGGTDIGIFTVSGASTSEHTITGRAGDAYTISIVALSDQLPSTAIRTTTISGESMSIITISGVVEFSFPSSPYLFTAVVSRIIAEQQHLQQFVLHGWSVTISVIAMGNNLVYQWRKDGVTITNATSATYTIAMFVGSDQGEYRCVVSSATSSITSTYANLIACKN